MDNDARRRWPGREALVGGLLVLAAVVGSAWAAQRPPSPVPASAPATEFSVGRAGEQLRRITGEEPTPIGSVGSDAIRDYL